VTYFEFDLVMSLSPAAIITYAPLSDEVLCLCERTGDTLSLLPPFQGYILLNAVVTIGHAAMLT